MKTLRIVLTLSVAAGWTAAQAPHGTSIRPSDVQHEIPANRGSAALWQSLKKLHTRASLIMITAHPDDEDGGMLAFESRGRGTRVSLLTLNRGEGGANVMSPDYFDALGLVRTMELRQADRYYGVEQYWTRVVDYGFSKTKAESIGKWTHDRVFADVVRVVRTVRPLVVTSVFVGAPSDGHGNHQTAGALAREVFKAAADPNVFPEQIQAGLRPWAPLKSYGRVPFRRRGGDSGLAANLQIPEGSYDPVLGESYVQLSRTGLGFQKSQTGGGAIPKAGEMNSPYHRFASAVPAKDTEESFFDGIDISLGGIATLAKGGDAAFLRAGLGRINGFVEDAMARFSAAKPEACAPALAAGLKATLALQDAVRRSSLAADARYDIGRELDIKRAQFNNALAEALGLAVYGTVAPAAAPDPMYAMFMGDPDTIRIAIPGQSLTVKVRVVSQGTAPVKLEKVSIEAKENWAISPEAAPVAGNLAAGRPVELSFAVKVPENAAYTRPYFSRPDIEQPYYDIHDEALLGQSLAPYPLAAWADLSYEGVPIRMGQLVQTVKRVSGQGAVFEPLAVGPAVGVSIAPRAGVVPLDARSFPVTTVIHSNVKGPAKGAVRLELPEGWKSEPDSVPFATTIDGQDQAVKFTVHPVKLETKPYRITAVAKMGGKQYREGYEVTGYTGLPPYFLYRPATHQTSGVDIRMAPDLKVAYITGSGDDVPEALEQLGVKTTFLSPGDLASADLSAFDLILLGVRTYAVREELSTYNHRLLEYVHNGGVMVVQYNTPEFDHNYGPYPYEMGRNPEEVTDEASKVVILNPSHPLFAWPNAITEGDFAGWVEERGSKWMKSWDSHYEALLETHDEGQEPQKGGLLYARYGKGIYVYNAYAFYRELPEGVPGAFRIFANVLSLPKNPKAR